MTLINLWHLVHLLVYELPFSNQKFQKAIHGRFGSVHLTLTLTGNISSGHHSSLLNTVFLCNRFVSHIRLVLLTLSFLRDFGHLNSLFEKWV